jgi:hypothetical protein
MGKYATIYMGKYATITNTLEISIFPEKKRPPL